MGFPSKDIGVSCHSLLQEIFLTQRLNSCLLHWQVDSLPLSYQGSPSLFNFADILRETLAKVVLHNEHATQEELAILWVCCVCVCVCVYVCVCPWLLFLLGYRLIMRCVLLHLTHPYNRLCWWGHSRTIQPGSSSEQGSYQQPQRTSRLSPSS